MKKKLLGKTGIEVSQLCFGGLTVGPLQANLPLEQGAAVMAHAFSNGINFVDTAELYQTYPYIRRAMAMSGQYDIVIASKTYAYEREQAKKSVEHARHALNRDVVDIFLLHEQESEHTVRGHYAAL
ncbi:MAG: aldo/keto reductase, partial [Hyphomonadaceae bacterium]|nr:aldo/keto reductase [Clostridia bacterium]